MKFHLFLIIILFFNPYLTYTEETNSTNSSSYTTCSANPLCANNEDNFTCVDEPYDIGETDFCSTFFENSTQSCCSKEYLDKLEETFLYYKKMLRGPAIETDDAIEEIQNNQSNFTEEVLKNIEKFANETEPVDTNRIRRILMRQLAETVSSEQESTTSTTVDVEKQSINNFTLELIVTREKTLTIKRDTEILTKKKSCASISACLLAYREIKDNYTQLIKAMKTRILNKLSEINNNKSITIIEKLEQQIAYLKTEWIEEYGEQKQLAQKEIIQNKLDQLLEKKKEQLDAYLTAVKDSNSGNNQNTASGSSNIEITEEMATVSENQDSLARIKAKIDGLKVKYEIIIEEAKAEINTLCEKYSISEKNCEKKLKEKEIALEKAKEKEKKVLEALIKKLEEAQSECKKKGHKDEECNKILDSINQQEESQSELQGQVNSYQQKFADDLEKKCLEKGYTLEQCETFVNKTVEAANQKAYELQKQQEIAKEQIKKATQKAIIDCKKSKKTAEECATAVNNTVIEYTNKITSQINKTKEKADKLNEELQASIEKKCEGQSDSECLKITERLKKQYEKKITQMNDILAQPVVLQENCEASEEICKENEIGDSDQCQDMMYEKLKKIKEKQAKLGIDSSSDETLALEGTMELYQEIKSNCSLSKNKKKCVDEVETKIKAVKKQHKEKLMSEITVNDTLIDLSPLLKGKLNKQLQNQLPIKQLNGLLKKYQQARKKCFSFILKLKSKFSCLACAGPAFFDKFLQDGKLHLHKGVCENTMKHCYDFFDLNEAASTAKNNIESLNESYSKLETINLKVENITKLIKEIKKERKSLSQEEIEAKISQVIDQIHEIEEIQGSKLNKKFITKRKPKLCSSETNCTYICDNFFSIQGLNKTIIEDPGIEQEVTQIEETVLDVYEYDYEVPMGFIETNETFVMETDDDFLNIQTDTTASASFATEINTDAELAGTIYSADNVEITIEGSNRRRLAEVEGSTVWDENGMDIEVIATGIDESLLEFEENPKEFKDQNYANKFSILIIGVLALLML